MADFTKENYINYCLNEIPDIRSISDSDNGFLCSIHWQQGGVSISDVKEMFEEDVFSKYMEFVNG